MDVDMDAAVRTLVVISLFAAVCAASAIVLDQGFSSQASFSIARGGSPNLDGGRLPGEGLGRKVTFWA